MVKLLKEDPAFAPIYLHQAFLEIEATGGMTVNAKRVAAVASATGFPGSRIATISGQHAVV
ncbi:hypothetical protein ACOYA6_13950 [Leclercia barmai]|uniref:hypothetical protein n=1 Tax=Leclercia barmai TaxID=2785629 RepID=UPI003BB968BA